MSEKLSAVAVVLDAGGGYRVVVDRRENLPAHVGPGEKLIIVPGYYVQEPVQNVPGLIDAALGYLQAREVSSGPGIPD